MLFYRFFCRRILNSHVHLVLKLVFLSRHDLIILCHPIIHPSILPYHPLIVIYYSHPSISTTIYLSSISNEIKNIKSMLSKIYMKSYADALSNSNDSIINTNTLIDNNSPINSDRSHRNSNNINQTSNSVYSSKLVTIIFNSQYAKSNFIILQIN